MLTWLREADTESEEEDESMGNGPEPVQETPHMSSSVNSFKATPQTAADDSDDDSELDIAAI